MTTMPCLSALAAPVFDRAALFRQCMEDRALAHNLLELYLADLTPRMTALRAAWHTGDRNAVQQVAHAIRGASLTVGALGMAQLTQDIESACRRGDFSWPAQALEAVERCMMATRSEMQCILKQEPASS
jgi:HPt (histidine-containing phosphotransfer) domain-containing protein